MNRMEEPNYISYSNSVAEDLQDLTKYGIDDIHDLSTNFTKTVSDLQSKLHPSFFLYRKEAEPEEGDLKQERLTLMPINSSDNTNQTNPQSDDANSYLEDPMVDEAHDEDRLFSKELTPQPTATYDPEAPELKTPIYHGNSENHRVQEIASQACNYQKEFTRTAKSIVIKVKPSKLIFESLENHLREKKVKTTKKGRRRTTIKRSKGKMQQKVITFNQKNFSKKLGDQFCEYVWEEYKINCNAKLKDKTSWKLLNKYLTGGNVIKGLSATVFMKTFVKFMQRYDIQSIDESKTNENSKIYYKICGECMKIAFQELELACEDKQSFGQVVIRKGFPEAIIEYFFDRESLESE